MIKASVPVSAVDSAAVIVNWKQRCNYWSSKWSKREVWQICLIAFNAPFGEESNATIQVKSFTKLNSNTLLQNELQNEVRSSLSLPTEKSKPKLVIQNLLLKFHELNKPAICLRDVNVFKMRLQLVVDFSSWCDHRMLATTECIWWQ